MSTSRSPASRIWLIVAAWPLINARERPFASTTRRNSSRFGSPSSACARSHSPIPGSESMANSAVTSARSAPERTCSLPARSPSVNDRASIRIDFPAPVSPVRAVKPGRNSSSRRSTIAKSRIDRCWSIRQLEHFAPVQLLPQHREVAVTRRVDELDGMLRAPDKDAVALLKVALQLPVEMKPRIDRALQGDLDHGAVADHDRPVGQRVRTDRHQGEPGYARLQYRSVGRKRVSAEMTVVRNEFESGENSALGVLRERMAASAYLWHNYGHAIIGARSDIENVPIERLRAFYRHYYQPDNAVLLVSGKLEESAVLTLAQNHFGKIPRPSRALRGTYTVEPTQDGERAVTLRRAGDVQIVAALS